MLSILACPSQIEHLYGLTVFENYLYATNSDNANAQQKTSVIRVNRFNSTEYQVVTRVDKGGALHIYHQRRQPRGEQGSMASPKLALPHDSSGPLGSQPLYGPSCGDPGFLHVMADSPSHPLGLPGPPSFPCQPPSTHSASRSHSVPPIPLASLEQENLAMDNPGTLSPDY